MTDTERHGSSNESGGDDRLCDRRMVLRPAEGKMKKEEVEHRINDVLHLAEGVLGTKAALHGPPAVDKPAAEDCGHIEESQGAGGVGRPAVDAQPRRPPVPGDADKQE